MRLNIFCPHVWPDTAPTGDVMRQLIERWAGAGHECHVVTSLPWYRSHRVEDKWRAVLWHRQKTDWGSVLRLHPCAPLGFTKSNSGLSKSNLALRAASFAAFGAYAAAAGVLTLRRADAVFAMSPPLTLATAASLTAAAHKAPLVLNLQDLHPDAAIATGVVTGRSFVAVLRQLEKVSYRSATAVTVLSDETRKAVLERAPASTRVEVIRNFPTVEVEPGERANSFRHELGIDEDTLVFLYAGNVGFSQPLGLIKAAAKKLASRHDICFVINGDGSAMNQVRGWANALPNVIVSDYQPVERLSEVLAAADVHLVLLAAGLGHVSVPSKVYSAFCAGRPVLAASQADSEISRIVETTQAGLTVDPTDEAGFIDAICRLSDDHQLRNEMEAAAACSAQLHSADTAAEQYLRLFRELVD